MQTALARAHDATSDQGLAAAADLIEASAWNDMVLAAPAWLRSALQLQAETHDGALALVCGAMDHLLFNRVIGLGTHAVGQDALVARLIERYQHLGIRNFWLHANATVHTGLARVLKVRGLRPYHRSWVKMLRPATPITCTNTALTVREAVESDGHTIASIVGPAFDLSQLGAELFAGVIGRPRWKVLIAECNGEPVAAAGLYVKDQLGYFVFAATRPSFRRMGAQRLLMSARAQLAVAMGCKWLITETGMPLTADEPNPSYHNMLWAGFRPLAVRANFCFPDAKWPKLADS